MISQDYETMYYDGDAIGIEGQYGVFDRTVDTLDISEINGEYYVKVEIEEGMDTCELLIYKVWLE